MLHMSLHKEQKKVKELRDSMWNMMLYTQDIVNQHQQMVVGVVEITMPVVVVVPMLEQELILEKECLAPLIIPHGIWRVQDLVVPLVLEVVVEDTQDLQVIRMNSPLDQTIPLGMEIIEEKKVA